jgi:glycosyltransferase involved in cell wall biosynthesis
MKQLTIGMPVYNDIEFIEQSLISLAGQEFQNYELIISDDGSTDGSGKVCEDYAKKDPRIKYIRQPRNLGISKNMEFLLAQSESKYFMWAGDDDLWDSKFTLHLISALENNPDCIVAFGPYVLIDENNNVIESHRSFDYSGNDKLTRLLKLIKNPDDGFGYGVFRTNSIREVKFPVWPWPNKKVAYNNIFPSLCFYLVNGDYYHFHSNNLFFKRVKTGNNVNHIIAGYGNGIKETSSYILRRWNLVMFSSKLIYRSSSFLFAVRVFFPLLLHWFLLPSFEQIILAFKGLIKKFNTKAK